MGRMIFAIVGGVVCVCATTAGRERCLGDFFRIYWVLAKCWISSAFSHVRDRQLFTEFFIV